jgi:NAD(P)-dependent dehydrogenase (short-subunit alcohol dehydrogenase family)
VGLLEQQVVLIIGAGREQGRAHALTSAQEGADVVLVDTASPIDGIPYPAATADDLAETVDLVREAGRRALAVTGHVRSQADLDLAVAQGLAVFGRIDALVANAGAWSRAPFWQLSEETWRQVIDVSLAGMWRAAKAVAPHMIARQSGSIVIISSVNGFEPGNGHARYSMSKQGVIGLMRTTALELAPFGVRCNAISLAAIDTPGTPDQTIWDTTAGHPGGTPAEQPESVDHFHALRGRTLLPPQVIADAALFLNSHLAAAMTGVDLPVGAGHLMLPGYSYRPTGWHGDAIRRLE